MIIEFEGGVYMFSCGYGYGFMIIQFLLIASIVIVTIKLIKNYFVGSNNSLKVLKDMYIKGEITEEEYKARKSFLENN